jgi:hypothetical protein
MYWMKYDGKIALAALLLMSCGGQNPNVHAKGAVAPQPHTHALERSREAHERLAMLEKEVLRLSLRLEQEGTAAQRARWRDELSDIEHDRAHLTSELQEAQRMPSEDLAAAHERLAPMIDVLLAVGTRAALEIDRSLDAER